MKRTGTLLALALTTTVALTACSSGSSDSGSPSSVREESAGSTEGLDSAGDSAGGAADEAPAQAPSPLPDTPAESDAARGDSPPGGTPAPDPVAAEQSAIIATGTVDLVTDDVAEARRDVQRLADEAGGRVAGEDTTTDRDGVMDGSRLELRVPSETFDATMTAVEGVATTASSTRALEDVGTQMVDTAARIRAQEQSLARIEALLAEAEDLGELVSIESELTTRQAALDSLTSQLTYLQDATAYSTITVYLERTDEATEDEPEQEEADGFLGGLSSGWDGLVGAAGGLALALGLLLPWLLVLAVVAVPLVWGVRRLRRRSGAGTTATAQDRPAGPPASPEGLPAQPGRP